MDKHKANKGNQHIVNQINKSTTRLIKSGQRVDSYIQYRVRKRIQSSQHQGVLRWFICKSQVILRILHTQDLNQLFLTSYILPLTVT